MKLQRMARKHQRCLMIACGLTAFCWAAHAGRAQPTPVRVTATPARITLSQALATARPPNRGVAIVVGAEAALLPKDAAAPPDGLSLADCADAFGRVALPVGDVTAIAPATMVLLNSQPGEPNPWEKIGTFAALRMLAASLDDRQWQALTSQQGMGLDDLTSDDQRQLFWALFPRQNLKVAPANVDGTPPAPESATDVSPDLPQARLRLSQTATFTPSDRAGKPIYARRISPDPPGVQRWAVVRPQTTPNTEDYGAQVRAEVPNTPKSGDLDFSQAAFQRLIPLAGLKTVGDLVSRIGNATETELYVDPHYASRTVTVLGSATAETAEDLLRALAFCVTGTYRKVGPAYLLTDDLPGVAVCQQVWAEFEAHADALREKRSGEAGATLFARRSAFDIPRFGDPLAATSTQERPDPTSAEGEGEGKFFPESPSLYTEVPFAQLTSAQQDAARRVADRYAAAHADAIGKDPSQAPDVQGKWRIDPQYRLEALLPSLPQPVTLHQTNLTLLTWPPERILRPREKAMEAWARAEELKKARPQPSLATALAWTPRRAVLAAPHSPVELASLVQAMQKLGLNQLWLYVFQDGVARVPGTPFPMPDGITGPDDPGMDLLGAALKATKGTGITVLPVLDLLVWGPSAPEDVQDINVLGETSVQIAARQGALQADSDPDTSAPPAGLSVSPFASRAGRDLSALVQSVVARPHGVGLVWRAHIPDGYNGPDAGADSLGYTLTARLTFLRRFHADPLDITENATYGLDFRLPCWDDATVDKNMQSQWDAFRADTDGALLRALYAAAQSAAPAGRAPLLVEQYGGGPAGENGWFGTWDDPRKPPPIYHFDPIGRGYGGPLENLAAVTQAKAESRYALLRVPVGRDDDAGSLARQIQQSFHGSSWDGLVLDITEADGGPGVAGLRRLAGLGH